MVWKYTNKYIHTQSGIDEPKNQASLYIEHQMMPNSILSIVAFNACFYVDAIKPDNYNFQFNMDALKE